MVEQPVMSDFVTSNEFELHAKNEEANQRITNDALHEGNIRMGNIERDISELATDLKPLLKLYHAVMGAAALGAMFIALLIFIYNQDRDAIKVLGESVQKHSIILEKMIARHEEFERDTQKEFGRIEKALEKAGR
jgi:hypothetical protein